MKRVFHFTTILLFVLAGCVREQVDPTTGQQMTIRVSIPSSPVKASFSVPGSGEGLHLAWQAGDAIRVIDEMDDSNHAKFDIQPGFTDHVAQFAGPAISGDDFVVIAPGTYTSIAEAEAGDPSLTQNGNGNTEHLVFTSMLSGVSKDYLSDISFNQEWADDHGATLFRGGIVKLILNLPNAVTAPKKVEMTIEDGGMFVLSRSLNITGISLTSEHVLTAYLQSSWEDKDFTDITVKVTDGDGSVYAATRGSVDPVTMMAGYQNIINMPGGGNSFVEELFAGGDGTQADPYLIANAKHLDNMHLVLDHQNKKYFRMIEDVDMETYLASNPWEPLNWESPYDCPVNFDGNNKTISNFYIMRDTSNEAEYTNSAFFGVLYGEVYDLTFYHAQARNESASGGPTGILAGYCGYDKNGQSAHVYNVHVTSGNTNETKSFVVYGYENSDIAGGASSSCVGGLAGRINNALIESCSFSGEVWSRKNYCGGIVGTDWGAGGIIRNCWTSGRVRGDQRVGGITGGFLKRGSEIINCFSTSNVDASNCAGVIAGHLCMDTSGGTAGAAETVKPENRVDGCIAWAANLQSRTYTAGTGSTAKKYSNGAIVGYTATHNFLLNCKRRSDMTFHSYSDDFVLYDQNDASPSTALVITVPGTYTQSPNYEYPYHGKAYSGTLSDCARSLGWSEVAWNLSGSTPVLTGVLDGSEIPSSGASSVPAGSRGEGPKHPVNGGNWHVESIATGVTYYHYENTDDSEYTASYNSNNNWHSGGNTHQNAYVVDVNLNNTDYEVKIVYTTSGVPCSEVFRATGAVAAINGAFELGSIALKGNVVYNVTTAPEPQSTGYYSNGDGTLTSYPAGFAISYMPNSTIGSTGVENWKSQGTFYCDGRQGVQISFDGYDPAKAPGSDYNPPVKSVEEERLFYRLCTDNKPGLISSAPMLIENYNTVGTKFHTSWYKGSWSDDGESAFVHQRSLYSRTAVALTEDNHLLLFVCDGKYPNATGASGMSASWVTKFLHDNFNPQYALNLDGGGSTTMCVANTSEGDGSSHVVNYPSDNYHGKYTYGSGDPKPSLKNKYDHAGERTRDSFIVVVPKGSL